jgi:hypothetical protein
MAHYAFLDNNKIVTEVITGKEEWEDGIDWEQWYGNFRSQICKRTSYNTSAGIHNNGSTPFRKNYAGIGYTFDSTRDAFIPPKPYASWVLVEETCQWKAPVDMPTDDKKYSWNEETTSWIEING